MTNLQFKYCKTGSVMQCCEWVFLRDVLANSPNELDKYEGK